MTKDEALKQALEVIEAWDRGANASDYWRDRFDAITAIREALAEQDGPKLPEFYARLEYDTPGWDVVASVYQRREDATPLLVHRETLPNQQPAPPPECQTEAEKTAFAFGWWSALEQKRKIDSALDRMAENARELGLDYEPIVEQVEDSVGMGHKAWDMVDPKEIAKAFHEALAQTAHVAAVNTSSERVDKTAENVHVQPAQQQKRKTSYEELERIADDLQELCDKQAIRLGKLEAQQQEPVAVVSGYYGGQCVVLPTNPAMLFNNGTAFYTSPQPSKPEDK